MLEISKDSGIVYHPRIFPNIIERLAMGKMEHVNGIVVHQTNSPNMMSALNSYHNPANRNCAHFLLDRNGFIMQTISLFQRANHVGMLKQRCVKEFRCAPFKIDPKSSLTAAKQIGLHEYAKSFPDRYPGNTDSIGIEIVGDCLTKDGRRPNDKTESCTYENITLAQDEALRWLINELLLTFRVSMAEIYRHPQLSDKHPTEAQSAKW